MLWRKIFVFELSLNFLLLPVWSLMQHAAHNYIGKSDFIVCGFQADLWEGLFATFALLIFRFKTAVGASHNRSNCPFNKRRHITFCEEFIRSSKQTHSAPWTLLIRAFCQLPWHRQSDFYQPARSVIRTLFIDFPPIITCVSNNSRHKFSGDGLYQRRMTISNKLVYIRNSELFLGSGQPFLKCTPSVWRIQSCPHCGRYLWHQ